MPCPPFHPRFPPSSMNKETENKRKNGGPQRGRERGLRRRAGLTAVAVAVAPCCGREIERSCCAAQNRVQLAAVSVGLVWPRSLLAVEPVSSVFTPPPEQIRTNERMDLRAELRSNHRVGVLPCRRRTRCDLQPCRCQSSLLRRREAQLLLGTLSLLMGCAGKPLPPENVISAASLEFWPPERPRCHSGCGPLYGRRRKTALAAETTAVTVIMTGSRRCCHLRWSPPNRFGSCHCFGSAVPPSVRKRFGAEVLVAGILIVDFGSRRNGLGDAFELWSCVLR
ncbi:uncharacterized protein DS421_17g579860 [Arachis hypogaea]|nr:uncharacterized protein DS421_17g579860 [Arachis hypogaea]